jgi:hypothetical protein
MTEDDRDLRESFAALRSEEEARVPPMPSLPLRAHKPRRRNLGRLVAATACLATIVAAGVWLLPGSRVPQEPNPELAAASITSWKPATDFLLDTPGRELLEGVPAIGEWHGAAMAPRPGERNRRFHQSVLP